MMTPTRREFMMAAGAALAAATISGRARAGEFTGRIKKAVKLGMVNEGGSVAEKFKLLQELGFDGVEIGFKDKVDRDEVSQAIQSTGLPVHGVVLGGAEGIEGAVDLAKIWGATSVLVVAGKVDGKTPYAKNYETTLEKIKAAAPYAEQQQIRLLVENVWNNFLLSPLEMARYIDEIGNPWVGVYFDVGNVMRYGWPEHWIPVLGKRIYKLDIKEFSRTKMDKEGNWKGFDVEIGDGEIDWPAVRRELALLEFNGWATAEVGGGGRDRLADIAARMNRVLDL